MQPAPLALYVISNSALMTVDSSRSPKAQMKRKKLASSIINPVNVLQINERRLFVTDYFFYGI